MILRKKYHILLKVLGEYWENIGREKIMTISAFVRPTQKRKDGRYKVIIRVVHNGSDATIKNDWFATASDIKKNGQLKGQLKLIVDKYILALYDKCNNNALVVSHLDAKKLCEFLTSEDACEFRLDFFAYVRKQADKLEREGRKSSAVLRRCAVNSLAKYLGADTCDINSVTKKMLLGWFDWILARPQMGNRKRGRRAPTSYKQQLQVVYAQAMEEYNDEDAGVINIPRNPFLCVKPPKDIAPPKRALSTQQIRQILTLPYSDEVKNINSRYNFAKDMFILSFFLIGMNIADLYECRETNGQTLIYNRKKTRTRRGDNARMEVEIPKEAVPLFNKYRDTSRSGFIFKFHKMFSTTNTMTASVNKGLKKIGAEIGVPDLQFYAARHSWATIAVNDCGIDKWTVHQALNHVDSKTAITDIYIKKDWRATNEANRKVISHILNGLHTEHPKKTL